MKFKFEHSPFPAKEMKEAYIDAIRTVMKEMRTESKRRVPVDTGALRKSIQYRRLKRGAAVVAGLSGVRNPKSKKPTSAYAAFQERHHASRSQYIEKPFRKVVHKLSTEVASEILKVARRNRMKRFFKVFGS